MGGLGRATNQARSLMTQLLDTTEFRLGVESAVSRATASVTILSAYLKHQALDHLMSLVPEEVELRVASRFRPNDLISGASDIDAAKLLIEKGAKFGISPRLHGKVFLIDDQDMYIGSSNLTGSGFGLAGTGNEEFGTQCHAGQADVQKLNKFLARNVQWLDACAIESMERELEGMHSNQEADLNAKDSLWSFEKGDAREIDGIWFKELPPCTPSQVGHYLGQKGAAENEFLGADRRQSHSIGGLQRILLKSAAYKWLLGNLKNASGNTLRFGALTALLHADLLDDPVLYRSSVKLALSNLVAWLELLPDKVVIKKYVHTSSVMLRKV